MQTALVQDLMTPAEECATVSEHASLHEAFVALQTCLDDRRRTASLPYDLPLLVVGAGDRIVGRLSLRDLLRGLQAEALRVTDPLIMVDGLEAWDRPLLHLAYKASHFELKYLLRPAAKGDHIAPDASLDQAMRQLIRHNLSSLLVLHEHQPVGVLTLVGVFCNVSRIIDEACQG